MKKPCQIFLLDRDKTKNKHYEQTLSFKKQGQGRGAKIRRRASFFQDENLFRQLFEIKIVCFTQRGLPKDDENAF